MSHRPIRRSRCPMLLESLGYIPAAIGIGHDGVVLGRRGGHLGGIAAQRVGEHLGRDRRKERAQPVQVVRGHQATRLLIDRDHLRRFLIGQRRHAGQDRRGAKPLRMAGGERERMRRAAALSAHIHPIQAEMVEQARHVIGMLGEAPARQPRRPAVSRTLTSDHPHRTLAPRSPIRANRPPAARRTRKPQHHDTIGRPDISPGNGPTVSQFNRAVRDLRIVHPRQRAPQPGRGATTFPRKEYLTLRLDD